MNDGPLPLGAPDDAAVIGDVREDADVDVHGPVDDLLAVGDPPAHLLDAALERAFASSPGEASAELVPHDDGADAAGSEPPAAPEALADSDRQGDPDQEDSDHRDTDEGDGQPSDDVTDDPTHDLTHDPMHDPGGDGGAGDGDDGW